LQILPKGGGSPVPYRLNRAQLYLHDKLEAQRKATGKVRALILKGRQQGISTYVGARFFHKTITNPGKLTFIFAHDSSASDSLYAMVGNYYDLLPDPLKPTLGSRNAKELLFPVLRSGYKVGTAGSGGLGRGKTLHHIHWSECAYSPNPDEHAAGLLQAVPDAPDTEVIIESTANGEGDYFHRACMLAMSGQSEYQLVFLPWYWQSEYTKPADDFEPDEQEAKYLELFAKDGLTPEHLAWRRAKIREFAGEVVRFKHEYPFNPEEAFEASDADSYIKAHLVRQSRYGQPANPNQAPLIFGVDPAALGGDKFVVCHRKGRHVTKVDVYPPGYPHEQANRLANDIRKYNPDRINVDAGGLGIGVIGCLKDLGFGNLVNKVDFGGTANDQERYYNRTAEMFGRAREWLEDTPNYLGCDEASASAIQAELSGRQHSWHHNSQLRMESKQDFKKRLKYSPDKSDAFLLTFAEIVAQTQQYMGKMHQPIQAKIDGWSPFL
jgi:hypothetical protein